MGIGVGLISFTGRLAFASAFIFSAWLKFNEFGIDGGPSAKAFRPKFDLVTNHISANLGLQVPDFDVKHVIAAAIALKGIGSILFLFGSSLGAYLLLLHLAVSTPILYDFYNYNTDKLDFVQLLFKFTQNLALFGALLFFLGMKNSITKRQHKKKTPKPKTA